MRMKMRAVLAAFVAAALIFTVAAIGPVSVYAQSSGELKNQLDILQDQKADIQSKLDELENKRSDNLQQMEQIVAQKNVIDQEIFLMHQQMETINQQISACSLLIADKQVELEDAQARLDALQKQNKARIRAMEKNGKISYWSVIFKANNFIDLLDRLKIVNQIAEADRLRMEQIRDAAQAVMEAKTSLETQKADLETAKQELAATQQTLEARRQEADSLLADLHAKGSEFEALIYESEKKQSDLMDQIAQKEEEYDDAKYQEWLANNPQTGTPSVPSDGGGTWVMPINYTYFTSPFGYRWHPIGGDWRMHNGVDLSAPTGTPIYASRSGVVTTASYEEGGAGYYVSINHLDGYASIYMHMTHYIVSAGQQVSAGQVIGYCGSTGGSTGPHLHFGISYNGVYVNPADYINIS